MNRPIRETWKYLRREDTEEPHCKRKRFPTMGIVMTAVLITIAVLLITVGEVVGSIMRSASVLILDQWNSEHVEEMTTDNNDDPMTHIFEQLSTGYRHIGTTKVVCFDKSHLAHFRLWILTHIVREFTIDVIVFKSNNVVVVVASRDGVESWVPITFEPDSFNFDEPTNSRLRRAVLEIVTHTDGFLSVHSLGAERSCQSA